MTERTYRLEDLPRRIALRIRIDPDSGCWVYGQGKHAPYGRVTWEGQRQFIHRFTYRWFIGPIPDGLTIDHVRARGCRHYRCCWPAHLEAVTSAENARRVRRSPEPEIVEPESVVIPGGDWLPYAMPTIADLAAILP